MMYKITGKLKNKNYTSNKRFSSEKSALLYAYNNLVYNPSGNTKRKTSLTNIKIVKA